MADTYEKITLQFQSLTDSTRLQILRMLVEDELCACELLEKLNISQSTLSYHMKLLVDGGLVLARKKNPWVYYRINKETFTHLERFISSFYSNES